MLIRRMLRRVLVLHFLLLVRAACITLDAVAGPTTTLRWRIGQRASLSSAHDVVSLCRRKRPPQEAVRGGGLADAGVDRVSSSSCSSVGPEPAAIAHPYDRVLILDVDGTLYGQASGVEQQIVDGIHRFFGEELGLSPAECDDVHRRHGSTIWGLQQEGRVTAGQVERYYEQAFSSINLDGLRETPPASPTSEGDGSEGGEGTGYQHRASAEAMMRAHRGPVFVASNSPLHHVRRVLDAVGLATVPFAGVLTPDTRGLLTKSSPEFYDPILEHEDVAGLDRGDVWLLDDSRVNIEVASGLGMGALRVNADSTGATSDGALPLDRALASFVGAIPHPDEWQFSDSEYLRSKNAVDAVSRSDQVWRQLEEEVFELNLGAQGTLRVADLGCGLLPLLEEFRSLAAACGARRLEYCGLELEAGIAKEACEGLLSKGYKLDGEDYNASPGGGDAVQGDCIAGPTAGKTWTLKMDRDEAPGTPEIAVRVLVADFTTVDPATLFPPMGGLEATPPLNANANCVETRGHGRPHVVVGCCLADLLPPASLLRALSRLVACGGDAAAGDGGDGGDDNGKCLVYLPITFAGKTEMSPPAPQEGAIPADESVLRAYDECLREEQGHHTSVDDLLKTIREHGGDTIALAPSTWRVSLEDHPHMWRCLLYFIGLGVAPRPPPLQPGTPSEAEEGEEPRPGGSRGEPARADFAGWVRRARELGPTISARNVDLLFRLGKDPIPVENNVALEVRGGDSDKPIPHPTQRLPGWRRTTPQKSPTSAMSAARALRGGNTESIMGRARNVASGLPGRVSCEGSRAVSGGVGVSPGGGVEGVSPEGGVEGASPGGGTGASLPPPGIVRDNAFLEFVSPGKVDVRHEELHEGEAVGEGQVLVRAICSSISSGTELKVFRGDFDSDSELDTTIKGMAGESMSYPLRYGYSLVGRVARCGDGVDVEKFSGKLVFAFSPHSSWVVADADGVMLVPEGIDAEDAVYLPAVETALSLMHDVHPRVGESVAVFGQGMIGLLAVSILARTHGTVGGGSVVAVDMISDRLRVAERLGASAAVTPGDAAGLAPFDISLEVTGNPRGLQSALDLTGYGGRVVLGSWYGGGTAQLNLGMAFHRSHLTIQTSQVSRLPAGLTDRWDKDRRFSAAWSLVKELRPSTFLTTSSPGLEGAQGAYESLGQGSELGVVFKYET